MRLARETNGQDRRLAGIAHTGPGEVAVSAFGFGYGYDAGGSITQWTQSQPFHTVEPMSAWTIEQDAADQLTGVSVEGRAASKGSDDMKAFCSLALRSF